MFRDYINHPIDPIPVEYINTINRLTNEPDYSLTCLGIALLKHRMENYAGIQGCYHSCSNELEGLNDFISSYPGETFVPTFGYYVYSKNSNEDEIKQILESEGYLVKENIGTFLKNKAEIDCRAIYHKDYNKAAIFINTKDMRYYHMNISFLSLLFPKLFENAPLEACDYEVIKACSKPDKDVFIKEIQNCVESYTMEFRRIMLNTLLKSMHETKIRQAERSVNEQREYVNNCKNTWCDAIKHLKDVTVLFEGLKATEKFDDAEEDFIDYLSTKKEIHALKMEGPVISFAVATLLNNYNSDAWDTFSRAGHIYEGEYAYHDPQPTLLDVFKERENRKILFDNLFCERPEFAIKIAGNYRINLENNDVVGLKAYDYIEADPIFKGYLPNPHIKNFGCLGGYDEKIPEAVQNRNYIGAVELCCASAGSVDLDETQQTFRPFLGWLLSSKEKVLKRRDGVEMTPEEALEYLINKEKNK